MFFIFSDQMGNKGAFITLYEDLKPNFTSFDAVVSLFFNWFLCLQFNSLECLLNKYVSLMFQPHPSVKPMAYANSMMSMFGLA